MRLYLAKIWWGRRMLEQKSIPNKKNLQENKDNFGDDFDVHLLKEKKYKV